MIPVYLCQWCNEEWTEVIYQTDVTNTARRGWDSPQEAAEFFGTMCVSKEQRREKTDQIEWLGDSSFYVRVRKPDETMWHQFQLIMRVKYDFDAMELEEAAVK